MGEQFVANAHLHVVGFTGKDVQRFILRLPAETADGAIVAVVVESAGNAKTVVDDWPPAFFNKVESSRFSIRPAPKTGVGMRKIMLLASCAALKLGCGRTVLLLQLPASERPVTVNRSSTPPLGLLVFAVPLALKKNGNLASRVGPLAVMKYGVESAGRDRAAGELRIGD